MLTGSAATEQLRLRAAVGADLGDLGQVPVRTRRAAEVALAVGAPLVPALDAAAAAEDDRQRAARAVTVASAQTRAVAGGLLLAPLVLVPGLGRLVGADLLGFYTSTVGIVVGAAGTVLLALGAAIILVLVRRVGRPATHRRPAGQLLAGIVVVGTVAIALHPALALLAAVALVARARRRRGLPPPAPVELDEAADLTAIALTGGVAASEALRTAADALPGLAIDLRRLALELELGADLDPDRADPLLRLRRVLSLATSVGAPAAPALRRLAHDLRADELARVLAAAERLPAQLTFPTALCLLPATLLLVGAPMVHAGLAAAVT